jgi:hypothetical protein
MALPSQEVAAVGFTACMVALAISNETAVRVESLKDVPTRCLPSRLIAATLLFVSPGITPIP